MRNIKYKNTINTSLTLSLFLILIKILASYLVISFVKGFILIILVYALLTFVLPMILTLFLIHDLREKTGGFWSFKDATLKILIVLSVSVVLNYVGVQILFTKLIDPDMTENVRLTIYDATLQMIENQNISRDADNKLNEVKNKLEETENLNYTDNIFRVMKSFLIILISSIILGFIYQKKKIRSIDEEFMDIDY